MAERLHDIERAHLRDPADRTHRITRRSPSDQVRGWIRRFWIPVWDVPTGQAAEQKVLQYPVCLAVTAPDYSRFIGPNPGLSRKVLEGRSWAFGTMFTPAAGTVLLGRPVSELTGSACELEDLPTLAGLTSVVREVMAAAPEDPEAHARSCALVEQRIADLGDVDDEGLLVNDLVEEIEQDLELRTVAELCDRFGIAERTLQRLTARRIGLSPAWLIRRRRLHEAAGGLRGPEALAELAARLGYADQAHFARDFRSSTGMTPREFSRRWSEGPVR